MLARVCCHCLAPVASPRLEFMRDNVGDQRDGVAMLDDVSRGCSAPKMRGDGFNYLGSTKMMLEGGVAMVSLGSGLCLDDVEGSSQVAPIAWQ